jgi:hypothetical protein
MGRWWTNGALKCLLQKRVPTQTSSSVNYRWAAVYMNPCLLQRLRALVRERYASRRRLQVSHHGGSNLTPGQFITLFVVKVALKKL